MMRVNLLQPLEMDQGKIEALVRTGGGSAFIARREVLLAFVCLGLAGVVLFFQLRGPRTDTASSPGDAPNAAAAPIIEVDDPVAALSEEVENLPLDETLPAEDPNGETAAEAPPTDQVTDSPVKPAPRETSEAATPRLSSEMSTGATRASNSAVLSQLVVSSEGNALRIFAATGNQPQYKTFQLDNPRRVVVDLPGVRLALPRGQHEQTAQHPQVNRIRAGQYRTDPPQSRIVLDVTTFPDIEILPQFNGLYLVVTERPQ